MVSTDSSGNQGNGGSNQVSISANGRYVAFWGYDDNLVPDDTNNAWDIHVKDTETGQTTRVSTDSSGVQSNGSSSEVSISADGRYVAFKSYASNLVPGDTNNSDDIFVKDRLTEETTRVSTDPAGAQGNSGSYAPSISADGRYVAFESDASNLVPGDTNWSRDVFKAATDVECSSGRPPFALYRTDVYWASYADYAARLLSVDFSVTDAAAGPAAYAARVTGATVTGGVTLSAPMPLSLGDIMPGSAHAHTIKYSVPASVHTFKTTISAAAQDACGAGYTYP